MKRRSGNAASSFSACDRVIVLFGGRVVQVLPANVADESTLLRAAHGLAAEAAG